MVDIRIKLSDNFDLGDAIQLFHQNYIYDAATVYNLRQKHNHGVALRLRRDRCGLRGLGQVVAKLESRYLLTYAPLSESSINIEEISTGFRAKWPTDDLLTFENTHFEVIFNPDPVIRSYPKEEYLVNGKAMAEILKSMEVYPTDDSEARYNLSVLAPIRLAVRLPEAARSIGRDISRYMGESDLISTMKKRIIELNDKYDL